MLADRYGISGFLACLVVKKFCTFQNSPKKQSKNDQKNGLKSRKNLFRTWLVGFEAHFEAHLVDSKSVYFSRKI